MKIDIYNTDKKYNIIYADPPWTFRTYSEKGKQKKSAECHYSCMKIEDIYNLNEKICKVVEQANKGKATKQYSFNGFVCSACEFALENLSKEFKI